MLGTDGWYRVTKAGFVGLSSVSVSNELRKQFVKSFVKRTVTLQENNEQLLQSIWRNVEIKI